MKLKDYFKTLKIEPQEVKHNKNSSSFKVVVSSRALKLGWYDIKPSPSQKELDEAIEWLDKNNLALPYQKDNSKLDCLISIK